MSWVRYDDGFHAHAKVTQLLALGPIGVEAIGLHVLANTWSSNTKRPGFVPAHQPGVLIANPRRGAKLAVLLEDVGLWDPADGGWDFHDAADYRASAKRQTPGTPVDLSAKRAAAGRQGGYATQQNRQAAKQTVQQTEQTSKQDSSKPCSPVVASNEATTVPVPVPTTSGAAAPRDPDESLAAVVAAYVDGAVGAGLPRPSERLRGKVGRDAKRLAAHTGVPALIAAARSMGSRGWDDLDRELQRVAANGQPARSRQDEILARSMLRAQAAEGAT